MSAEDFISSILGDSYYSKIDEMSDDEFSDFLMSNTLDEIEDFLKR